jgi:hypothetical protein
MGYPRKKRRRKVALTYRDVEHITYHMGWDPIDADVFWLMALKLKKHGAQ